MALHEIPHHRLDAFARELAIVALVSPRIGEALELEDRVGVFRESLRHGLELTRVLTSDFSLTGVEVDDFCLNEPVPVATGESLRESGFGLARSCFGAARTRARLTHPQVEAVEPLIGLIDRLASFTNAI